MIPLLVEDVHSLVAFRLEFVDHGVMLIKEPLQHALSKDNIISSRPSLILMSISCGTGYMLNLSNEKTHRLATVSSVIPIWNASSCIRYSVYSRFLRVIPHAGFEYTVDVAAITCSPRRMCFAPMEMCYYPYTKRVG